VYVYSTQRAIIYFAASGAHFRCTLSAATGYICGWLEKAARRTKERLLLLVENKAKLITAHPYFDQRAS
jgi:hypothetical protein